jgi:type IV fimbrial biogenesis protein FimT
MAAALARILLYARQTIQEKWSNMDKRYGFSVLELVVALSIIAIVAAIATPNMISWRSNAKLSGAVNNLRGDLQMAKSRATKDNAVVVVVFTATGYRIFVDNGVNAADWSHDADEPLLRDRQLPAGITIKLPTDLDPPNNRTRFNSRGFPDPATLTGAGLTGNVILQDVSGRQMQINLNRLGRISNS